MVCRNDQLIFVNNLLIKKHLLFQILCFLDAKALILFAVKSSFTVEQFPNIFQQFTPVVVIPMFVLIK